MVEAHSHEEQRKKNKYRPPWMTRDLEEGKLEIVEKIYVDVASWD